MSEDPDLARGHAKAALGITPEELAKKSDSALALWQANETAGSARHILAEREWQRRMLQRQLKLQWRYAVASLVIGALLGFVISSATTKLQQQPPSSTLTTLPPPATPVQPKSAAPAAGQVTAHPSSPSK